MDLSNSETYPFPLPQDEATRLAALHSCNVLDLPPQKSLYTLTELAGTVFSVPVALLTLIDTSRQIMLATHGTDVREMPRSTSFCTHALLQDDILFVPDASQDHRFSGNPLVTSQPHIRFYAGAPLMDVTGYKIGTFCLIDHLPRPELSPRERRMLKDFATIAAQIIAQS
jgi:GAF domain-containing protein